VAHVFSLLLETFRPHLPFSLAARATSPLLAKKGDEEKVVSKKAAKKMAKQMAKKGGDNSMKLESSSNQDLDEREMLDAIMTPPIIR
jgi:hypothetical protein